MTFDDKLNRYESELGLLPESWEVVVLENYLESLIDYRGKTPKKAVSGITTLSAKSVKMGNIKYSSAYYISKETYDKFMVRSFPKKGDVLLTTEAPLGCVALLDRDDVCVAQRLLTLRGEKRELDNRYLQYYLMSHIGQHQLLSRATGSTVQGIKRTEFSKVLLIRPPFKEQINIAKTLGELDEKIELNTQTNQTLEQIAQAIFKSWFVDFEPVKAKISVLEAGGTAEQAELTAMSVISAKDEVALKQLQAEQPKAYAELAQTAALFPSAMGESELGDIPYDWSTPKINEIAKIIKGKSYKSIELEESNTALVTLKSFNRGGGYRLDGLKEYTGKFKPEQEVFAGDLIIAYTDVTQAADVIGKPAMVISDSRYDHLVISLDVAVIRPKNDDLKYYLYGIAKTNRFQQHTNAHSTGTTVLHLSKNAVPDYKFTKPNEDLIKIYRKHTQPIFMSINENIEQNTSLAASRDALLPKLLSGELTIPSTEEA
ncbi:type I restriction enzyme, S subunit [Bathymodiolus platifrons methanotrophic gill symbiont]|uniref:restriction endonuclease subunit S n=1 Tax=Bathymodiolus platifrons methanotrophic gill symbiont TaxID=113268 RepID=UPI000B41DD13|nr:restriction endonuclease subunit S [Bathymodiolus platifrons methanotrophic gill symbiont]GAW87575.1 type I restriction enzyme, S subunit [Bathymodiolus platifrons methanotrophic gill symbiont]GFO76571.1 type I restriction enzyme, S subunit [Bathymodiolus platifrons methanotrophic gill symbiont]